MDNRKFRCSKHTTKVWGSSSKPYTVSCKDGMPTCSCVWYAVQRNKIKSQKPGVGNDAIAWCKHIEAQLNVSICNWRGVPVIVGICPQCGSSLELVEQDSDE